MSDDHLSDLDDEEFFERLSPAEQEWSSQAPFFESSGYVLRPRYRPGWVPSWRHDPPVNVFRAEDHLMMRVSLLTFPIYFRTSFLLLRSRLAVLISWMLHVSQMGNLF